MAGYPPPYPPGAGWKEQSRMYKAQARAQQQAWKAQARAQQQQVRMQNRALRRSSVVGPVLLVGLGVLFLLVEMGRLSWWPMTEWFGRWWPMLLIVAGIVRLCEWAIDHHVQETRAAQGLPPTGTRIMGGGVIWLIILIVFLGGASHFASRTIDWNDDHFRFNMGDFDRALGDAHDSDESMTHAINADGVITIDNPRGDVTVSGTSDDGQMHIAIHKEVYALKDHDADKRMRDLRTEISGDASRLTVGVPSVEGGGHADFSIDVPRSVTVMVTADRGDVQVNSMHAAVTVNANHGNVDLSGVDGAVVAHMHNDSATFSAHSVTGTVNLDGRAGDINVSDIHGSTLLDGDFFGTTHLEHVDGHVHFKTSRTDFQLARLDGEMELDTDAELNADQILGPVVLSTRQKDITLERVQGNVQVTDRDGSVTITNASPLGSIDVTNKHGSVDVGVPPSAGFVLNASTRHGDIENDFALENHGSDDNPQLNGTVGHGGPMVHIETTDGDVKVHKSSVDPLAPVVSVAPKITVVPAPNVTVKIPKMKAPSPPVPPKAPTAPSAPSTP